jgi:predicted AlkP superfamily pyrophosphatase or phosphodiesterase
LPERLRALVAAVLALAITAPLFASGSDDGDRSDRTVVLISFDGMRWDYPDRAGARGFARMAKEGASCRSLLPPFPSSTFPAHATLATGVYPDRHGIVNNEFFDRRLGVYRKNEDASWLLSEPIWVTAERQGVRTAVYHWVFSYTSWRGVTASLRVPFSRRTTDVEKVDRIVEWLAGPPEDRPRLILSYLHGPDAAGHADGPVAPSVLERVRQADRLVVRLLRAVESVPGTALLVVSDHGMAPVSRTIKIRELLKTGPGRRVRSISSGAVCNLYCPDEPSCASAETALRQERGVTVYRLAELPVELRYRQPARTGDLVAMAPAGAYFVDVEEGRDRARGMHGYRPDQQEMQGIFYAWGAGIRPGARIERMKSVDIAPLVCRLLDIECPAGIDGRVRDELLLAGAETRREAPPSGPRKGARRPSATPESLRGGLSTPAPGNAPP